MDRSRAGRQRLSAETKDMVLLAVITGRLAIADARAELSAVVSDLYRHLARNHVAVKLIDRCAREYPELAEVWFGEGRGAQYKLLVKLIARRSKDNRWRRVDSPDVVARTILEIIAYWAMHRHFDPAPPAVDDATAEAGAIDLIVHCLSTPSRGARK